MSLRDQLFKSGLASKEQTKRAEREVKKQKHASLTARKQDPQDSSKAPPLDPDLQKKLDEQRAADRERNRLIEEERRQQEARARAIDIMIHADLSDLRGKETYYFIYHERKIGRLQVNEVQLVQLAQGQLAIASYDVELRFFLLSPENAAKVHSFDPAFILCFHNKPEKATSAETSSLH